MEEVEARAWVQGRFDVPRETMERLDAYAGLLREENERQNLVSAASLSQLWVRHIADSAQLLTFVPSATASWVDLGTGPGLPGLVIALLHKGPVTLIEERRLRVDFLHRAAGELSVSPEILGTRVERVPRRRFDVISARAFAPLPRLLELGTRFSTAKTVWILPKGRNAQSELEALESSWQGEFRLEPSLTDADAQIIVAEGVRRGSQKDSK
ncbi:MAG: 16S rRNA (guanine(527)-N(7))-methyltransferase RsmG [Allosphingosinicella sp.]